jgi:hypothetical protein
MAEKLRSALNPIHWFLLLKAVVVAGGWYFLSPTIALILLTLVYVIPPYRSGSFALAFLVLFFTIGQTSPTFLFAILMGLAVYTLLGVKNLILINRATAYQVLVILLLFFMWLTFFSTVGGFYSLSMLFSLIAIAVFFYYFTWRSISIRDPNQTLGHRNLLLAVTSFLVLEWGLVVMFLPLPQYSQVALALLVTGFLLEIVLQYISGQLTVKNLLVYFSMFFPLLVAVLVFTPKSI